MPGHRKVGWIFLLSENPNSIWGSVEGFYDCIDSYVEEAADQNESFFEVDSDVFGRLQKSEFDPRPGDGLAFYHSGRAKFPEEDKYRRKPRISLIGELLGVEREGCELSSLSFKGSVEIYQSIKKKPLIRDDSTKHLFEQAGMVQGAIATMFRADSTVWSQFQQLARTR